MSRSRAHAKVAYALTHECFRQLRSRNFVPSGFFEDDRNKLQELFVIKLEFICNDIKHGASYHTASPHSFDKEFDEMVIQQEKFMTKVQAERNSKLESDRKNKLCVHTMVSTVWCMNVDMDSEYADRNDIHQSKF